MEILGTTTTQPRFLADDDLLDFDDDLLDFTLGDGEGGDTTNSNDGASFRPPNLPAADFGRRTQSPSFPEFVEEELEWLSNKDAFPSVESCFGILSDNPEILSDSHLVLDNTTFSSNNTNGTSIASCCTSLKVPTSYPVRARIKRRRRANFSNFPLPWLARVNRKKNVIRCLHCQTDETPQWRAGPMGPNTLCNACGVRYKSGRLLPEYRPANSPTFCSAVHSNSHKKVVEMRRQKQENKNNVLKSIGYGEGYCW